MSLGSVACPFESEDHTFIVSSKVCLLFPPIGLRGTGAGTEKGMVGFIPGWNLQVVGDFNKSSLNNKGREEARLWELK